MLRDLPQKSEVILFHGLTGLQKKLYKAILMKDLGRSSSVINCMDIFKYAIH